MRLDFQYSGPEQQQPGQPGPAAGWVGFAMNCIFSLKLRLVGCNMLPCLGFQIGCKNSSNPGCYG